MQLLPKAVMLGLRLCCHCVGILNIWTWSAVAVLGSASNVTSPGTRSYKPLGGWTGELHLSVRTFPLGVLDGPRCVPAAYFAALGKPIGSWLLIDTQL